MALAREAAAPPRDAGKQRGGELSPPASRLPPHTLRTGPSEFPCPSHSGDRWWRRASARICLGASIRSGLSRAAWVRLRRTPIAASVPTLVLGWKLMPLALSGMDLGRDCQRIELAPPRGWRAVGATRCRAAWTRLSANPCRSSRSRSGAKLAQRATRCRAVRRLDGDERMIFEASAVRLPKFSPPATGFHPSPRALRRCTAASSRAAD